MVALEIQQIGDFMKAFLVDDVFDSFYLCQGDLQTFASFSFDGILNEAFYSDDEKEKLAGRKKALWAEIKPFVYQMIRGKNLPLGFKFTLALSDKNTDWLLGKNKLEEFKEQLEGLYLNIIYRDGRLLCITGLSYNTFVMDKRLQQLWDDTAKKYLKQNKIVFSIVS